MKHPIDEYEDARIGLMKCLVWFMIVLFIVGSIAKQLLNQFR